MSASFSVAGSTCVQDLCLSECVREQKCICKFVCTHVCTGICFPVTINILWVCMCVCHLSFEDHKYGRGSRQARCLFSVAVDNASEVVTFSHPSIPPFIHPSFNSSLPQERTPWPFKQATIWSDQTKVEPHNRPPKIFSLCYYSSTCQFLCLTLFLSVSFSTSDMGHIL